MSFTCPRCRAVSHNPNDERERYCGRCHVWVDDPSSAQAGDCEWCGEPLGLAVHPTLAMHPDCGLRAIMGSVGHQLRRCPCHGGTECDDPCLTRRQAAAEAAKLYRRTMGH